MERTIEPQTVAVPDTVDRDVIGFARDSKMAMAIVLFVRDGALVSVREVPLPRAAGEPSAVLHSFIGQFYDATKYVPTEILVPFEPDDPELLTTYLTEIRGAKVKLRVAQRGVGRELAELADRNASLSIRSQSRDQEAVRSTLELLRSRLELPRPPDVIECFDVSHLSGREVVASMVRFVDGRADRSGYRHFRIRENVTNDDFGSMNEVLRRRYKAIDPDDPRALSRPDLIVVDGGKGQLSSACAALAEIGYDDPPIAALAKARAGRDGLQRFERLFVPGRHGTHRAAARRPRDASVGAHPATKRTVSRSAITASCDRRRQWSRRWIASKAWGRNGVASCCVASEACRAYARQALTSS